MESFEITNFSDALTDGQIPDNVNIEDIDVFELFDSDILDSIPGLRELKSLYKGYVTIRDRLFTKKFVLFIKEFNSKTLAEGKLEEFKTKFDSDKKYRSKIMENLILFIDAYKNLEKVKILSKLFRAHIEGHYDWNHLQNLADCLDRVNLDFIKEIPTYDTTEGKEVTQYNESEVLTESNLISSGLAIKMSIWSSDTYPTRLGRDIYKYGVS